MAITSEIIGKLGGADVESVPVSGEASGGSSTEIILHTVQVPAGETWMIAAIGVLTAGYDSSNLSPSVYLGTQKSNGYTASGPLSMAIVAEGEITFRLKRNNANRTDSFTGHVYTVKM